MRIRMKVELSGTRNGQPWPKRGETVDLPDDEAAHYCTVGLAEPATALVETAVAPDAETSEPPPAETPAPVAAEKRAQPRKGKTGD